MILWDNLWKSLTKREGLFNLKGKICNKLALLKNSFTINTVDIKDHKRVHQLIRLLHELTVQNALYTKQLNDKYMYLFIHYKTLICVDRNQILMYSVRQIDLKKHLSNVKKITIGQICSFKILTELKKHFSLVANVLQKCKLT